MRYSRISKELFQRNRKKLTAKMDKDSVAIIFSNDQMVRSGDQYFAFRQNSDLFYLSGIEQEMSVLMILREQDNQAIREFLFIRKPDPKLETWEGKKLDKGTAGLTSGLEKVYWLEEFEVICREIIHGSRKIYINIPDREKFKPDYPLRPERMMELLEKEFSSFEYLPLAPFLTEIRLLKEPEELDLIHKAIRFTAAGFERILKTVEDGIYEYELEAELIHEFVSRGASGHAYPPIVASGANACYLHYIENDRVCRNGDLVLLDFGAEYANYAADCSRTIPVNGRFSPRQKKYYEATLRIFYQARSLLKPGININQLNLEVGKLWEEEHIKLKLYSLAELNGQNPEVPLFRKYYPHGTSHFLGLDVHDVGGKEILLKPGMVLTCEPGIYIPEEGIGIRLENDILITEEGNLDLMESIPIEAEEIEQLMKKD